MTSPRPFTATPTRRWSADTTAGMAPTVTPHAQIQKRNKKVKALEKELKDKDTALIASKNNGHGN
ncbi:hypothetical protein AC578_3652 [Pseudocercospora eumusae]|uniref:Uncharacterized protein n=1 Tax=Pseudocercospora eumusae TaxID=321146 RepID=A0A139GV29_9PEZI|nr:hypothetical protein AC578_3652 [Pseudocercospora eumusae]